LSRAFLVKKGQAVIETNGLTKRFGQVLALDDLTIDVREGEVLGILGPNGAGKTTAVRLLSCLIAPTSGRASVGGFEVGRDNHRIREIVGILTESPGLYDRLSARQNLDYYARLYGMEADNRDSQVERYLRMLGLWERRDDRAGSFSKGMQQKLSIARALVHEPKVMFLDEPTSALDPESARTVRDFIGELRSQGRTIILCTHNLDEADRLCDRIAIVKQRLIRVDSPSRLRSDLYQRRIEIQLRAVTEPVLAAVRAFDFVNELETQDNRLVMSLQDPEQQNPGLIRKIVEAGGEVQFVEERRHSLEEVYLALVRGEGEA
jgi:ABC-2 type transport system ATP-binding protein